MEEYPNWLEIPDELMANILQRLDVVEILGIASKVCTTWRRICKNPAMWKVIDMLNLPFRGWRYDLKTLIKKAVDLSCGELIDISFYEFVTDDILDYIVLRSDKLKRLCIWSGFGIMCITGRGLSQAVKRLLQLEELCYCSTYIDAKDIEAIGQNCPQLKSFMMQKVFEGPFFKCDDHAFAIAKSMPGLRHLDLVDGEMTSNGLQAILNGCPYLQSLDVRSCDNLNIGGDLEKVCMERIKDFKKDSYEITIYDDEYDFSQADLYED